MVVKIIILSWIPIIIRHLEFRIIKRDHNFDNHPYRVQGLGPKVQGMGLFRV